MNSAKPASVPIVAVAPGQKIDVSHDGGPHGVISTLRYRRSYDEILKTVREKTNELIDQIFAGATDLPEVNALYTLREKRLTIDDELARLQLDLDQAEVSRRRAVADLTGEKLAAKLAKIDADRRALSKRIEDCKAGGQLFEKDVADATEAARKAVEAHVAKVTPAVFAEAKQRLAKGLAAIEESTPLLEMLDDVAVADRVGQSVRMSASTGFGSRIKELLAPAVRDDGKAATADTV